MLKLNLSLKHTKTQIQTPVKAQNKNTKHFEIDSYFLSSF